MKILLSKTQWEQIGKVGGFYDKAYQSELDRSELIDFQRDLVMFAVGTGIALESNDKFTLEFCESLPSAWKLRQDERNRLIQKGEYFKNALERFGPIFNQIEVKLVEAVNSKMNPETQKEAQRQFIEVSAILNKLVGDLANIINSQK